MRPFADFRISECFLCNEKSIWQYMDADYTGEPHNVLIFPIINSEYVPNRDLRKDIQEDYQEAASIINQSPRGAAALLRLCIQKLCHQLGESGEHLDTDIENLVKKGLSPKIQQALDVIRVIGNNAVHPGKIDLKDDPSIAHQLFGLINIIAQTMLSDQKAIDRMYSEVVPEEVREKRKRQATIQ